MLISVLLFHCFSCIFSNAFWLTNIVSCFQQPAQGTVTVFFPRTSGKGQPTEHSSHSTGSWYCHRPGKILWEVRGKCAGCPGAATGLSFSVTMAQQKGLSARPSPNVGVHNIPLGSCRKPRSQPGVPDLLEYGSKSSWMFKSTVTVNGHSFDPNA